MKQNTKKYQDLFCTLGNKTKQRGVSDCLGLRCPSAVCPSERAAAVRHPSHTPAALLNRPSTQKTQAFYIMFYVFSLYLLKNHKQKGSHRVSY